MTINFKGATIEIVVECGLFLVEIDSNEFPKYLIEDDGIYYRAEGDGLVSKTLTLEDIECIAKRYVEGAPKRSLAAPTARQELWEMSRYMHTHADEA